MYQVRSLGWQLRAAVITLGVLGAFGLAAPLVVDRPAPDDASSARWGWPPASDQGSPKASVVATTA